MSTAEELESYVKNRAVLWYKEHESLASQFIEGLPMLKAMADKRVMDAEDANQITQIETEQNAEVNDDTLAMPIRAVINNADVELLWAP